jgi:hypothetical protein
MAGLIATNINKDNPLSSISGYEEERVTVGPDDTVAGQVNKVIGADSPLMQGARTRATQSANARGLINSSMAVQAGEEAVHGAALPIASQDAQTNFNAKLSNQNAANSARQYTAGATNAGAMQERAGQIQRESTLLAGEIEGGLIGKRMLAEKDLIGARTTGEKELIGSRSEAESRLQTERGALERQLQELRGTQQTQLTAQQADVERDLLARKAAIETELQGMRGSQAESLQAQKASQELVLQNLRGEQAERITNLEGGYKELLQASASASSLYTNIVRGISEAMNNGDMDEPTKQNAVNRQIDMLESGLAILGGISGLDLRSLLSF